MANNKKASEEPGKRRQDGRTKEGQAARSASRREKLRDTTDPTAKDEGYTRVSNAGVPVPGAVEIYVKDE
jgi:hypothetical protein